MSKETAIETYAQSAVWRHFANHFWMDNGSEYLVLDACEVNEVAIKGVRNALHRLNADEIAFYTEAIGVPAEAVQTIQTTCGESCKQVLYLLLGENFNQFAAHMIVKYGRGLILAEYDDEEIELEKGKYCAYRIG